jgi:poly [ADP-ribose] polymerase 2/3/4
MKNEVNLICADIGVNANKYWKAILHENGDVECEWGRVGVTKQTKTFRGVGQRYIDKKVKEKEKKGYRISKLLTGELNVKVVSDDRLSTIAKKQIIKKSSIELTKLVDKLVKYNIHKITESTNITYDKNSGLFSTPLGIVTPDAISEARRLLSDIKSLVVVKDFTNRNWNEYLNEYLTLIPQNIGMRRAAPEVLFPTENSVLKQNDILDSLLSSYESAVKVEKQEEDTLNEEQIFDVTLEEVDDSEFERIRKKYIDTRKDMHVCSHLKVKKVFSVRIGPMANDFEQTINMTNLKELWHGTSTANLLSILKSGLHVTPPSTANITGKLFGNGIYFASDSTKSLNYSSGFWGGKRINNCYMFLGDIRLGKYYVPKYGEKLPKNGYDSTWAKAKISGVYNDEFIVYNKNQCNLTYLVEFDDK